MAIQIEVYKDATVTYKNGSKKQYDAIYPTFNGLVTGELVKENDVYESSKRRRFGKAKPVEKQYITYYCFNDLGFIRDGEYTFFNGNLIKAYRGKLTLQEKWDCIHL